MGAQFLSSLRFLLLLYRNTVHSGWDIPISISRVGKICSILGLFVCFFYFHSILLWIFCMALNAERVLGLIQYGSYSRAASTSIPTYTKVHYWLFLIDCIFLSYIRTLYGIPDLSVLSSWSEIMLRSNKSQIICQKILVFQVQKHCCEPC